VIELGPKGSDAAVALAEAHLGLARLYEKQGRPGKAAECLDQLVAAATRSEWLISAGRNTAATGASTTPP